MRSNWIANLNKKRTQDNSNYIKFILTTHTKSKSHHFFRSFTIKFRFLMGVRVIKLNNFPTLVSPGRSLAAQVLAAGTNPVRGGRLGEGKPVQNQILLPSPRWYVRCCYFTYNNITLQIYQLHTNTSNQWWQWRIILQGLESKVFI